MDILTTIAASITAIGVIGSAFYYLYRIARKIDRAIGEDKDGRTVSDRLERVESQVFRNGGNSIADKVASVEKTAIAIESKMDILESLLHTVVNGNATSNNNKRPTRSRRETSQKTAAK